MEGGDDGEYVDVFSPRPQQVLPPMQSVFSNSPALRNEGGRGIFPILVAANENIPGRITSARANIEIDEQDITEARRPILQPDFPPRLPPRRMFEPLNPDGTNYTIIRALGIGGEGTCTQVEHNATRQVYALKVVWHPDLLNGIPREAAVLGALKLNQEHHPHIIYMEAFTYITDLGTPYAEFYLPYYPLGDLYSLTSRFFKRKLHIPELFIWKIFHQAASALEFLHRGFYNKSPTTNPGLVHRDIKPENILLRATSTPIDPSTSSTMTHTNNLIPYPDIVIADFGHAVLEEFTYTPSGTNLFRGPELPRSSPKGDVWGLGAVIHNTIHGRPPIAELPAHTPRTKENYDSWHSRPEAREPEFALPWCYSDELADVLAFTLRDEGVRPYAELLRRVVGRGEDVVWEREGRGQWGLPDWAFGAIL